MIYGYALLKKERETYGLPSYRSDDWGDFFEISKVRLFASKRERDNAIEIEKKNYREKMGEFAYLEVGVDILPFATKSNQGKLHFKKKLTIAELLGRKF